MRLRLWSMASYIPASSWEESRALNPSTPAARSAAVSRRCVFAMAASSGRRTVPRVAEHAGATSTGVAMLGPSGVGIWSSPTLDLKRRRLCVTTGNNYSMPATPTSDAVMALDLDTGRIAWTKQLHPDDVHNSACSTEPKELCPPGRAGLRPDHPPSWCRRRVGVSCCLPKSGIVWAIDPEKNGEVMWETRVAQGGINGGMRGMAADGEQVYAATSDVVVIQNADRTTTRSATRWWLTALKIADGSKRGTRPPRRADEAELQPCATVAVTAIPGVVFWSQDGHLRAYSTRDGSILWAFDTVQEHADRERREGKRRRHRRARPGGRQRHGLRQFRLHAIRRRAGQRAAGVWRRIGLWAVGFGGRCATRWSICVSYSLWSSRSRHDIANDTQSTPFAKDGMIRAGYLATNPAHAVKDSKTGEARGDRPRSGTGPRARGEGHSHPVAEPCGSHRRRSEG